MKVRRLMLFQMNSQVCLLSETLAAWVFCSSLFMIHTFRTFKVQTNARASSFRLWSNRLQLARPVTVTRRLFLRRGRVFQPDSCPFSCRPLWHHLGMLPSLENDIRRFATSGVERAKKKKTPCVASICHINITVWGFPWSRQQDGYLIGLTVESQMGQNFLKRKRNMRQSWCTKEV